MRLHFFAAMAYIEIYKHKRGGFKKPRICHMNIVANGIRQLQQAPLFNDFCSRRF